MNTMDALWLSAIELSLVRAQRQAAEIESYLQVCAELSRINEFCMPIARLRSAAMSYRAAAEQIERMANQIQGATDANLRSIP